jgi:hypothetical protein
MSKGPGNAERAVLAEAGRLGGGMISADVISRRHGVHPDSVRRVIRKLTETGVIESMKVRDLCIVGHELAAEQADGQPFGVFNQARTLRSDEYVLGDPRHLDVLAEAVTKFDPVAVFALFSGGYDSLCATHLAAQHPLFTAAVHIDTTIGIEETRAFVRETCEHEGWPLREYRPTKTYDQIVLEHGFPGADAHKFMYRTLKERPVRQLIRDCQTQRSQKVILVTGVRSDESVLDAWATSSRSR